MACLYPAQDQIQALKTSARLHQNRVHRADSRSVGSCEWRWKTNMSSTSSTTVPMQNATQYMGGTESAFAGNAAVSWASSNDSTITGSRQFVGPSAGVLGLR